jgi:hypothetical protein
MNIKMAKLYSEAAKFQTLMINISRKLHSRILWYMKGKVCLPILNFKKSHSAE